MNPRYIAIAGRVIVGLILLILACFAFLLYLDRAVKPIMPDRDYIPLAISFVCFVPALFFLATGLDPNAWPKEEAQNAHDGARDLPQFESFSQERRD